MYIELGKARNDKNLVIIKAEITFKTTEEGGKSNPIRTGYRPNHAFEKPAHIQNLRTYIGEIQFSEHEFIYPGETKIVTVIFLKAGGIEKYLVQGQKWYIYEVPKLVAEGEILEVE